MTLYITPLRKSCNACGAASLDLLSLDAVIWSVLAWNVGEPGQSIIARGAVRFVVLKNFLINSGHSKKRGVKWGCSRVDLLGSVGRLFSNTVLQL